MKQKNFNYINTRHANIKFTMETEVNKIIPFLDVLIDNSQNILNYYFTSTYHKSRYSGLLLKGATKFYFTHDSCVVIILFNTGLYKSVFSTYSFGKLVFLSLCLFCVFCCLFWIWRNLNIYIIIIYIVGVRYSVFFLTYHFSIKQFVRIDTLQENLTRALT